MSGVFDLVLDPSEVAENRTELALNSLPIVVDFANVDWGDATITEYLADRTVGSLSVGRRWPNRTITIPLIVQDVEDLDMAAFHAAKEALMQKVARIQAEGLGWFKRQDGLYADVVNATLTFPDFYGELFGFETGVVLTLECLPDFYSDEITLSQLTGTSAKVSLLEGADAIVNLVPDPSFEYDTPGSAPSTSLWLRDDSTVFTNNTFVVSETWAISGVSSLHHKATHDGSTTTGIAAAEVGSTILAVEAGLDYTAQATLNVIHAGDVGQQFRFAWFDGTNTQIGSATTGPAENPGLTGIFTMSLTETAPAGAASLRLIVGIESKTAAQVVEFYLDGVMVVQGDSIIAYGDGDTLGWTWEGTAGASASRSAAIIDGALPARCRIQITDTSGNDQNGVIWGIRSQYYDNATTAKLLYEAETLTAINGSSAIAHSGANGGTTVINNELAEQQWMSVLVTDLAGGGAQLTHRGSYRLVARCYSSSAAPQVRLLWGPGRAATFVTNPANQLPDNGDFYQLDLGTFRIDSPPIGPTAWRGVIQAYAANANDPLEIDQLKFVPIAEGSGSLATGPVAPASVISTNSAPTGVANSGSGTSWTLSSVFPVFVDNISGATTKLAQFTGFGFDIPGAATIVSITVDFNEQFLGPGAVTDHTVQLLKAGSAVGSNLASSGSWAANAQRDYQGVLWGTTWTAAQVNASNFGVQIAASGTADAAQISAVKITIGYVLGAAFNSTNPRVIYASETLEIRTDGAYNTTDGTVYAEVVPEDGDLPRIPPSGYEQRPVQLLVSQSRGNLISLLGDSFDLPDSALDAFDVTVYYRPSWLFAP